MKTFINLAALCVLLLVPARLTASEPPVTLAVKPTEPDANGSLIYAPIGANDGHSPATGRFWFQVTITNTSGATQHVNKVQATFITGGIPIIREFPQDFDVPANSYKTASLQETNVIVLSLPAPASVIISVFCDTYDTPKSIQRPLAAYVPAVPGGHYIFPADEGDMGPEEYFGGGTHEPPHTQGWGTDWRVYRIDANDNATDVRAGFDGTTNSHKVGWGVPIRAIADGIVLRTSTGWISNPKPGERAFQKMAEYDGDPISDVKVTRLDRTHAATLERLPTGQVRLAVWEMADVGRQITRLGVSDLVAGELVTDMALDDLSDSQVVSIMRLSNGIQRLIVWDVPTDGSIPSRNATVNSGSITEGMSVMAMSESRFATAVRSTAGALQVVVWAVSGTNIQFLASNSAGTASSICVTALSGTRIATSLRNSIGALQVIVWDLIDNGNGTHSLLRRGDDTADAITRVSASLAIKTGWTRNRWVTAMRTNPGGVIKLIRWDASDDGRTLTRDLETLTTVAVQDTALASAPGNGADISDNVATASVVAGGVFKINGWGDPDTNSDPYEYSAQNSAGAVDRVSLDQTDELEYFAATRTAGGALKIMTWHWAHGGGNSVIMLHGNCRVLYAHFQEDSVDTSVLYPGASIAAGQYLGRMGNSGSAGDVHTHINSDRLDPLPPIDELIALEASGEIDSLIIGPRPMPFHSARAMLLGPIVRGGEDNAANSFATLNGHGSYNPSLGIRPRLNTRYLDRTSTGANPTGRKDVVPPPPIQGAPPTGGPFRATVTQALGAAPSGTRLYIRGGNYNESAIFNKPMTVRRYDYYDSAGSVIIGR